MSDAPPAPDQAPGARHPRETTEIFGQDKAQAEFLSAFIGDRLHHGWLLTGSRGTGKATLAWTIARFLLATPPQEENGLFAAPPPTSLAVDPEHPVARRILAGADPGLAAVRRSVNDKTGRLRDEIVVDDIRALQKFFGLSATDGGRRVVIVDAADEMNVSAANALLKMLEEPPARATLLLVSHQPSRLLPTIRSRCRALRLGPLAPEDMVLALHAAGADIPKDPTVASHLTALSVGSVGDALRLLSLDGLRSYAELVALMGTMPRLDRPRAIQLAESAAARGAADRFDLLLSLIDRALARLARTGAVGQAPMPEAAKGEAETFQRLAPNPGKGRAWADLATTVSARTRHGQAVNLDPATLVLDTVFKMQETAPR